MKMIPTGYLNSQMRVIHNNEMVIIVIVGVVKRIWNARQESVNNLDGRRRRRTRAQKLNAFVGRRRPVEFATKKTDLQLEVAAGRALSLRTSSFPVVLFSGPRAVFRAISIPLHPHFFRPSDFDVTNMPNAYVRVLGWEKRYVHDAKKINVCTCRVRPTSGRLVVCSKFHRPLVI